MDSQNVNTVKDKYKTQSQRIKKYYGIDFPISFYEFYDFAQQLTPDKNWQTISKALQYRLGSAFDVFRDDFDEKKFNPLYDDRHYNDPPEFLTIISGVSDGEHYGIWVDDPQTSNICSASYYSNDAFEISLKESIFYAMRYNLEIAYEDYKVSNEDTALAEIEKVRDILCSFYTADRNEIGNEYVSKYMQSDLFKRVDVIRTDEMAGVVAPQDKCGTIYKEKPVYEMDVAAKAEYLQMGKKSLDDGYPGSALAVARDLWLEKKLRAENNKLMSAAYKALGRDKLDDYLQVAIKFREDND